MIIDKQSKNEIFPSNPLREVEFRMRFPMNLWVMRDIASFYEQINQEYPDLERQEIVSQDAPIQTKYVFSNSEETKSIVAAESEFIFKVNQYLSFEEFIQELTHCVTIFCDLFKLNEIGQFNLHYINNISITLDEGIATLIKYVKPYLDIQVLSRSNTERFAAQIVKESGDYLLIANTALIPDKESRGGSTYILDFNGVFTENIAINDISRHLINLHNLIKEEFLLCITEEYKQVMREEI